MPLSASPRSTHCRRSLIGQVANNALNYHLQVTPPHLMTEALSAFDEMIAEARLLVLSPPQLAPLTEGHPIRLHRANQIVSLAKPEGGLGHTTALVKSPCAFLAATLSLITDPSFDVPRDSSFGFRKVAGKLEVFD